MMRAEAVPRGSILRERTTRRPAPRPALTIGQKIGACFAIMALVLTAACGLILHRLDRVRTDSGKLL